MPSSTSDLPSDPDLLAAKKALERIGAAGYYDLLAGLCRSRRTSSALLARNATTTVLAIEKAKGDLVRELASLQAAAIDIDCFQRDLCKVRLTSLQHQLLDSLVADLAAGEMKPSEKSDLLKFLTKELAVNKDAEIKQSTEKLSPEETNERIRRLAAK